VSSFASHKAGILGWLRLAFWEEHWSIGLIDREAFWRCVESGTLADEEVLWLRSGKGFFLADPCWISEAERLLTAECFSYRRRIGTIVLAKEADGQVVRIGTIKVDELHHSYPMVYAVGDGYLIIPETAGSNRISAISIDIGGKVIEETAILTGCRLVDPTVFFHHGSYWLFANPLHNFDDELIVFHGDSAVGPWHATALRSLAIPNCRGAGRIFEKDGVLYWPTQYNSHRYGGGVILRRILSLTDTELEHEVVSVILPDPDGSRPLGFHTVCNGEQHYLVDGLDYVFSPLKPVNVLISRARRRLSPLRRGRQDAAADASPAGARYEA
jgi:hypothetical protein